MHRPLFSWFQGQFNPDDARHVMRRLFAEHGVQAVFAAHDHFYYEEEHDGVRYVTSAAPAGRFTRSRPRAGSPTTCSCRAMPAPSTTTSSGRTASR